MKKFLITTALGGILFLVPLVFAVVILGKAYQIMNKVAEPFEKLLPIDSIAGVGILNIITVLIMLLVCVIAGLIARSRPAQALYQETDGVLLELIPGYAWTKTVMSSVAGSSHVDRQFKPVLVTLDDQMQMAFELERTEDNLVVVFFPGAPDVRSGSVAYVTPERVTPAQASFLAINKSMRNMGMGASKLLPMAFPRPCALEVPSSVGATAGALPLYEPPSHLGVPKWRREVTRHGRLKLIGSTTNVPDSNHSRRKARKHDDKTNTLRCSFHGGTPHGGRVHRPIGDRPGTLGALGG